MWTQICYLIPIPKNENFQGNFNLFLDIISVAKHFENSQLALNLAERGLGALDARTLGQIISERNFAVLNTYLPPKKPNDFIF